MSENIDENIVNEMEKLHVSDMPPTGSFEAMPSGNDTAPVNLFDVYKAEGNSLVKSENFSEALEKYDLAWNVCRTDSDRAMILNNRGVVCEKLGETEKALGIFNEALAIKPEYIKVLLRRAMLHKKLKNFEMAIEDLSDAQVLAVKTNQNLVGLQEGVMQLYLDYAEVELNKIKATKIFDFPNESWINAYFRGFYCDPISRLLKGLDVSPLDNLESTEQGNVADKPTGFLAALTCMKTKEYPAIQAHCTVEIGNPGGKYRMEALLLRGSFHFLCGDCAGALADFQAICDSPDASNEIKSSAHLKAALCLNLWGTCEEAALHFCKAEKLWRKNADVYYHAAVCMVDKGEGIPANALLEKGIEEIPDPKHHPLLHVLRLSIQISVDSCLYGNMTGQETLAKLKEMEQSGVFDTPDCYEICAQVLLILSESGEEALEMYDKAVELAGGCKFFQLKKVMATLMKTEDHTSAIKALESFTNDPDVGSIAYYHIGEIMMISQKFDEGFDAIDKSIEMSKSIYDVKLRVMGKIDFKYNTRVAEKMTLHGVKLFPQTLDETHKALE